MTTGKNRSQQAFEAQLKRKLRGTERQEAVFVPQAFTITRGALEKAYRLGEQTYQITKRELGEGYEVGGLLLGSKDKEDLVIRNVCLTRQKSGKLFITSAEDFAAGVKPYKELYRIMGVWHTHPHFNCTHSPIDDTNLNSIVFPQIAAHNFLHGDDDVRLLDVPVKIRAENAEDGTLLNISEKASGREIRLWLPGCRIDVSSLEERIAEFDLLYNRLREVGFALSVVLDLEGNYHAKIAYAPRKPTFELDTSQAKNDIIQFNPVVVDKDITFTDDELVKMIYENVKALQRPPQPEKKVAIEKPAKKEIVSGKMGADGRYHLDVKDI